MLEVDSFDHSNTFRVPSTINEISDAEVTQAHWSNTGNYDKQTWWKVWRQTAPLHGSKGLQQVTMAKQGSKAMEQRSQVSIW